MAAVLSSAGKRRWLHGEKALVIFPGFFKAHLPVWYLEPVSPPQSETHKFEVHYSDRLLGPLGTAEI
jgi:hypothetical protein